MKLEYLSTTNSRYEHMVKWLSACLDQSSYNLVPIAGDASFRTFYRLLNKGQSYIVIDAPPDKENSAPFISLAHIFRRQGIKVPDVITYDQEKGFILVTDFGSTMYLQALTESNAATLYHMALQELLKFQTHELLTQYAFSYFDKVKLQYEMSLFTEWFLENKLEINLTNSEKQIFENLVQMFNDIVLEQPQVVIHRDYHSRNLMLLQEKDVGILDFQDACIGPLLYDVVSLLKDCYISWPSSLIYSILQNYYGEIKAKNILLSKISYTQFMKWFDIMGVQRHMKAIGIFARLSVRDGKHAYLQDIPRVLNYISNVIGHYPEFDTFHKWFLNKLSIHLTRNYL